MTPWPKRMSGVFDRCGWTHELMSKARNVGPSSVTEGYFQKPPMKYWLIRAAAPATFGAACEVPSLILTQLDTLSAHPWNSVVFLIDFALKILLPGAITSGFMMPLLAGPPEEK